LEKNDLVPLALAAEQIAIRNGLDTDTAQQTIIDAYNIGDLELFIRRPTRRHDGSFNYERLEPNSIDFNPWNHKGGRRQLFAESIIDVPAWIRRPRHTMRRVPPTEACKVFVSRRSLRGLLQVEAGARGHFNVTSAHQFVKNILDANPNATLETIETEARKAGKSGGRKMLRDAYRAEQKARGVVVRQGPRRKSAKNSAGNSAKK
jgi:hypothetical protein